MSFERIYRMAVKELLQTFRNPRMAGVVVIAPIVQLLVFGYAATTDVRNVELVVCDRDNTPASRRLTARFLGSGYFTPVEHTDDDGRVRYLLDRGRAQAALVIDAGFGGELVSGRTARVQIVVDGTDSNTAAVVITYAARIARDFSDAILVERLERQAGRDLRPQGVDLRRRAWFNSDLESRNFYVPGVIANIVMLVTLILTSMAVVREREIGTMEQIAVTPITPAEFIAGKTLPFALVGLADAALVMLVGVFWFEIPMRGSVPLLFACLLVFLLATLGTGLLVSTLCQTQQQAMLSTFFFFFPALMLSGFIFPIDNMPEAVQWLTYADPLRYFMVILRGVFLKGLGMETLWPQVLALALTGAAVFGLAVARFRKTLE
jgi:ABC-2 type transport system permease protein